MTNLATRFCASALALTLGGCAMIDTRTMGLPQQRVTVSNDVINTPIVLDPCSANNIKKRPQTYVTQQEIDDRRAAGEAGYFYNGYLLYGPKSFFERAGTFGGGALGGVAGNAVGAGSGQAIAIASGITLGLVLGEFFSNSARMSRLAREEGCEAYIDKIVGAAPLRQFITGQPDNRPINTVPRGLENRGYVVQPGPYSETSPGGRREFAR